jgi:hypothetical protein
MKPETLQAVREFVSVEIGVPAARIKPESRLLHDLGVDGDDAGDLLQHFSARFHVDISAFQFSRHFGPEAGWNPLYFIYRCLFARRREPDDLPVTIQDLAEAAEAGVWRYAA